MTSFVALYPVMLDVAKRPVLVVGAGPVGAHKAAGLRTAGAHVTVVSPAAVPEVAADDRIRWHQRPYCSGEAANYALVITATNDPAVNAEVAADARAANVWVNSADDPANCSFILPSVVRRGDLCISVSTNGRSPALARWARQRLEALFTDTHEQALCVLSEVREELRSSRGTSEVPGWNDAISDEFFGLIAVGAIDEARLHVRRSLALQEV